MTKKLWISVESATDGKLRHKLIIGRKVAAMLIREKEKKCYKMVILEDGPEDDRVENFRLFKDAKARAEFLCNV